MRGVDRGPLLWGRALGVLGLLLLGPLLLLSTPLALLGRVWRALLAAAIYGICAAGFFGTLIGAALPVLVWLEKGLRSWVAWFAKDPESLWLHWTRHAHHAVMAQWCLDRAVQTGGREALFQEALAYQEGGQGMGGVTAGMERLRRAAQRGHPEAAFRLAEALRTGAGAPQAEPQEAEVWYARSAKAGFGPAAAWLARAYQDGDGVPLDPARAAEWDRRAEALRPHPELTHSPLRHDAGPGDVLVTVGAGVVRALDGVADRVVAHRVGRWGLLLLTILVLSGGLILAGSILWAGSLGLFYLPLLVVTPLFLMIAWQAFQLAKDRPSTRRDRPLEAAEAGDPEAQYQLGLAHRQGDRHRMRDDLSAAIWFRKAAEAGHQGAMAALAQAYLGGHGVLRDPREAARWAEAARRESTS